MLRVVSISLSMIMVVSQCKSSESPWEFFRNEAERNSSHSQRKISTEWAGDLTSARALLARRAEEKLGASRVQTAMALGKIESGYRCNAVGPRTRHGRAQGILQVLPSSAIALGIDPSTLRTCEGGIEAGLRHMKACIESGAVTNEQIAACHVAGVKGWRVRLARGAERYKRQYVRMAHVAWARGLRGNW